MFLPGFSRSHTGKSLARVSVVRNTGSDGWPTTGVVPGFTTVNAPGRPCFRPLNQLARIFPISEETTFFSVRGDHSFNQQQSIDDALRLQPERPHRHSGRVAESNARPERFLAHRHSDSCATLRLSLSLPRRFRARWSTRRVSISAGVTRPSIRRFRAGRIQISGPPLSGPNPFSPVDRTENRFQFADNLNWIHGNHTFKFGGDINFINVDATFRIELPRPLQLWRTLSGHAGGRFHYRVCRQLAPALDAGAVVRTGVPGAFIQGFGNPDSSIKNRRSPSSRRIRGRFVRT